MVVICAVYDEQGKQHYQGENGVTAIEIAKSMHGTSFFKTYHRVGDQVCVNNNIFSDGKPVDKKMFYVPMGELEILTELMK